jgi:hypothetical protein
MGVNRVFFPQDALDAWLAEERVSLDGELLTLLEQGQRFRLEGAVRILAEVADGGDAPGLVGKVKTVPQIEVLEAEHVSGSLVLGDNAYEVVEGFVGQPLESAEPLVSGDDLASAARAAVGDPGSRDSMDALTRFLLEK